MSNDKKLSDLPIIDDGDLGLFFGDNVSAASTIPNTPDGAVHVTDGKVLVYDSNGNQWKDVADWEDAKWETVYYIFKAGTDEAMGAWSGPLDTNNLPSTYTIHDTSGAYHKIVPTEISKQEWETLREFDALPVLEIERESVGGILLKFPD